MPTICDKISGDLQNNCENKPVAGVSTRLTLINKTDIASIVYDDENPQIVRAIYLKAGTRAYYFDVYKNTHKPRTTSVNRTYGVYQKHEIVTAIMTWDIATKLQAEALLGSKIVAIAENLQETGDARVEIYGLAQGLTIAEGAVRDTAANDGVFNFTLANEDEYPEPNLPKTFAVNGDDDAYSYALTIAAVNNLLTPASSNANLSGLTISVGTLVPAFSPNTTSYTVAEVNAVSSVTMTPTAADADSVIRINGTIVDSGDTSSTIPLTVGANTVEVEVTAEDASVKTYSIVITRAAP